MEPADRKTCTEWILQQQVNDDFSKKISFSDEVHIELNGYINKQNCRIWVSKNPRVIFQHPKRLTRVNVWCTF